MTHRFDESMRWSEGVSGASDLDHFYRGHFPDLVQTTAIRSGSNVFQKNGVDRVLFLGNGKQITVDEKFRKKDYGDFLCEEWSVWRGDGRVDNAIGWTLDPSKTCDRIAWIIVPTRRACLLPYDLLRTTCTANLERYKTLRTPRGRLVCRYPLDAENPGYRTRNISIPWSLLWSDMRWCASKGVVKVVDPASPQLELFGGSR